MPILIYDLINLCIMPNERKTQNEVYQEEMSKKITFKEKNYFKFIRG